MSSALYREAVRLESWNSDSGETQIDRKVMFNKGQDLKLSSQRHFPCPEILWLGQQPSTLRLDGTSKNAVCALHWKDCSGPCMSNLLGALAVKTHSVTIIVHPLQSILSQNK